MRLCEQKKIVPCLEPQDHQAGVDSDSVKMTIHHHCCFIIAFGELTGNAILTVYSGASAGTKTTAETFNYRATAADLKNASGDALGTEATSAALTLTAGTYEDRMLVVEMDQDDITDGQPWLTLEFSSDASEFFVSVVAVMEPRYKQKTPPTAIA
jgi:hypothetical protein